MPHPEHTSRIGIAAVILGAVALLLALVTVWQGRTNRGLQGQVGMAQQQLAKAQTMANLDNSLIQMLAKAAVDTNDAAVRGLLEQNGVQLKNGAKAPADPKVDANVQ